MAVPLPPPRVRRFVLYITVEDSDLQISRGWGGCSTYNGLYGEVPWLPLERNILFFCSGFRYEWVGISPVDVY